MQTNGGSTRRSRKDGRMSKSRQCTQYTQLTGPDSQESQRLTPGCRAGLRPPPHCHPGLCLSGHEQRPRPPRTGHGRHQLQITERIFSQGHSGFCSLRAPRVCAAQGTHDPPCADSTPLTPTPSRGRESGAASARGPALDRKPSLPPHGASPRSRAAWPRLLPQKDPRGASQRARRLRGAVTAGRQRTCPPRCPLSTQLPAPGYSSPRPPLPVVVSISRL